MDKLKVKKLNKSTPHCPSWQPNLMTASPRKTVFSRTRSGAHTGDFRKPRRSYSPIRRPDPTAPHLKYGLFSKKLRNNSERLRNTSQQSDYIIRPPHINIDVHDDYKKERKQSNTKTIRNGRLTRSSVFVYPSSTRKLEHHLSVSEVKHLDIKPRITCNTRSVIQAKHFQIGSDIPSY